VSDCTRHPAEPAPDWCASCGEPLCDECAEEAGCCGEVPARSGKWPGRPARRDYETDSDCPDRVRRQLRARNCSRLDEVA
jgi:hypothetical protein